LQIKVLVEFNQVLLIYLFLKFCMRTLTMYSWINYIDQPITK